MSGYYESRCIKQLSVLVQGHANGLTSEDPSIDVPEGTLKVQLRSHQKTALTAMARKEQLLTSGISIDDQIMYSNYGILGDSVGVGKSLMILGHIARVMRNQVPEIHTHTSLDSHSNEGLFSLKHRVHTDISEAGCLVVIPHTLYRQWADYVKKQTTLKAVFIDKVRPITDDAEKLLQDILAADLVLVSNTMYKSFSTWQREKGLRWRRFFLDEADTIHIVAGYPYPVTRFSWLVTASWANLIYPNSTLYIPPHILQQYVFAEGAPLGILRDHLRDLPQTTSTYNYLRYSVRSASFLKHVLNDSHPLRGHIVTRCSDQYIKESISLPPLIRRTILCKPSLTQQIVGCLVSQNIQTLLHAGDVNGAIEALGVKVDDTTSIVDAVTKNLQKELVRLEATRAFKESLEYVTPRAKEEAIKNLDEKITKTKDSIKSLDERIKNFKQDSCPICYDDPQDPLLTPCCNHVFCGQCLLTCMTRSKDCPMCRTSIHPSGLVKVVSEEEKNKIVVSKKEVVEEDFKKKPEALLDLFKKNPDGRFLIFSRYDNPFTTIEEGVSTMGIKVSQLKGNKDHIASTLRQFQSGEIKCLLLNSRYAGAGLNITAATHVVLLHAMTLEEEKQILGRAYRMGRTGELTYVKLLHPDEMPPEETA